MWGRQPVIVRADVNVGRSTQEVHEHRAPTDESVALLKEMEKAARDKIVASMLLDNNAFKALLNAEQDVANNLIHWRIIFDMNGRRMDVTHSFGQHLVDDRGDLEKQLETFIGKVATEIAAKMIRPGIQTLTGRSGFGHFLRATKPPTPIGGTNGQS